MSEERIIPFYPDEEHTVFSPDDELVLPDDNDIASGLVAAGDRLIIRPGTRLPMLEAIGLSIIGARKTYDRIVKKAMEEEMGALAREMDGKGLFGEHPLIQYELVRERVTEMHGYLTGSLLGISGRLDAQSDYVSRILFAWQTRIGRIIFTQLNVKDIQVEVRDGQGVPTVEFQFAGDRLLSQPLWAKGALVRQSFGHPNGYIDHALVSATFRAGDLQNLEGFIVPLLPNPK